MKKRVTLPHRFKKQINKNLLSRLNSKYIDKKNLRSFLNQEREFSKKAK